MRVGFYRALTAPTATKPALDTWIAQETAELRKRQDLSRLQHEAQMLALKGDIERIERDIAACERQLATPSEEVEALAEELAKLRIEETQIQQRITDLRLELVTERAAFLHSGDHGRFAGLNGFVAAAQSSNSQHVEFTAQAYQDRAPWYEHRKTQLSQEQEVLLTRKTDLQSKVTSWGFMTGDHIHYLLSIASLLACLCGWAMAIIAGATAFDDNTILEVLVRQILRTSANWQAEHGPVGHFIFFLGWMGLYLVCLGMILLASWVTRKFNKERQSIQTKPGTESEELNPELNFSLENDSFGWVNRFGPNLIQSLAPAWILLGIVMVFMTPGGVSKIAEAENAYSGFIIGFAAAWVAGLGGYFLVYQRQESRPGRRRGWVWLLVAILAAGAVSGASLLLGDPNADHFHEIAGAAGVLTFLLIIAAGLIGRILQVFFTAREIKEVEARLDRISVQLSRVLSPWSTMLEYPSAAWMRKHVRAMQEQYGQIRFDWLQLLRWDRWGTSDNGTSNFYDKLLPEYQAIDHLQGAKYVGKIETEKRALLLVQNKVAQHLMTIRDIRSLGEPWQQDLRKRLSSLVGIADDRRQQLQFQESEWITREAAMTAFICEIESHLRRGWDSGCWYLQHTPTLQNDRTWNLQP